MSEDLEDKKGKAELREGRPDVCTFEGTLQCADFDKFVLGEMGIRLVGRGGARGVSALEGWRGFASLVEKELVYASRLVM